MANQFISIAPKGIQRNTPDRSTPDGALLEAINVRLKDGAFRGVGDKYSTGWFAETLFEFDEITYHPALPANTYIVHNISDNKIYKVLFTNGTSVQVTTLVLTLASGEVFDRFSHLGNVLLVFTDINKYILFWDSISSTYKDLTFLPVPIVNVTDEDHYLSVITSNYSDPSPFPDYGYTSTQNQYEYHRQQIMGEYLKEASVRKAENRIEGVVLVRLAYKLFDGSYIKHSQPFIARVGYNSSKMYFDRTGSDTTMHAMVFAKLAVYYHFFNTGTFSIPDMSAMGVVESLDVFVSNPVSVWDSEQNITKWTVSTGDYYPPVNTEAIKSLYEQPLYLGKSIPVKDIIKQETHSVSSALYYSAKAGVSYPDFTKTITANDILSPDNFSHHTLLSHSDYQYNSKIHLANIRQIIPSPLNNVLHSLFIRPLSLAGYVQDKRIDYADLDDYKLRVGMTTSTMRLYHQAWIKTDKGRKVITSELQKSYVVGYDSNEIPDDFDYFIHSKYNEVEASGVITTDGLTTAVNGTDTAFTTEFIVGDFVIIDSTEFIVTQILSDTVMEVDEIPVELTYSPFYYVVSSGELALILNPVVSYPDYRAYKLRFYYIHSGVKYFLADYELTASTVNNIAYFVPEIDTATGNGYFKPNIISIPGTLTSGTAMPSDNPTDDSVIYDTNRMQVSAIFNVFMWPAEYSYRFGLIHNELIAIQGVQQAMSDSAFGQYPLYVFSLHGIFTIQQGTDVLYASIQPLNNEVLLNRDCIISISGAIIFGTREGLRMISGSQVEELSIDVEGSVNNLLSANPYYIDAISGDRLPVINAYRSSVEFKTYLQSARLFYDTESKEIIVSSTNYLYSYAYSFYSASWYSRTEVFYGNLLVNGRLLGIKMSSEVVDPNTVYTYSLHYFDQEDFTEGLCDYALIQTRPVNLSNSASKNIACLISLCDITCKENEFAVQLVAGSNDLIHWNVVSYNQYNEQISNILNKKVLGNFKYFIFVLAGERNGFIFNQFDVEYKVRFNNKLR